MAKLNTSHFILKDGRQIIFRSISPEDAESFLKFREQVPHDSTNTMQYVGMQFPTIEETVKRLAAQEDDKVILNIGAFDSGKVIGYLNFRMIVKNINRCTSCHLLLKYRQIIKTILYFL
jgi:hypothetical protein